MFGRKPHPPPPDLGSLRAEVEGQLTAARTYEGVAAGESTDIPIALRAGERMFLTVSGAVLIETRRGAGHWTGANQGVSVRVPGTKSMRYRVGATRGTYVPGDESPTPIDQGSFTITTTRATFVGAKQTREWSWAKLIGVAHQPDSPWTAIAVSNRQKTSGVGYDAEHAGLIRFWLDLAVARANHTSDAFIAGLEAELAAAGGPTPRPLPPPPHAQPAVRDAAAVGGGPVRPSRAALVGRPGVDGERVHRRRRRCRPSGTPVAGRGAPVPRSPAAPRT